MIYKEALNIWQTITKGGTSTLPDVNLEIQKRLLNIFSVGDYYYFIFNAIGSTLNIINDEVESILGYKKDELDLITFVDLIHPEDMPWFLNFEAKVAEFLNTLSPEEILNYKMRYDYRVQKKNGSYIRILQQVITLELTHNGGVSKTLGVHTDISHLKKDGRPVLSFIGLNGLPSYVDVEVEEKFPTQYNVITQREKEVLLEMVKGKESDEIADYLNISKETVYTHRRNLLRKTSSRNSNELIASAVKKGWV
jgi:DNA-binding CsgD family transcriptional regulator